MPFGTKEAFFAIEEDLIRLSRYVELCSDNLEIYSFELARLLLIIGSEVDIAFKELCKLVGDPNVKYRNMIDYKSLLLNKDNNFDDFMNSSLYSISSDIEILMPDGRLIFWPWKGFTRRRNSNWWVSYNAIKHDRVNNYKKASLKNVLLAASALFHQMYCLKTVGSSLFWGGVHAEPGKRLFCIDGIKPEVEYTHVP